MISQSSTTTRKLPSLCSKIAPLLTPALLLAMVVIGFFYCQTYNKYSVQNTKLIRLRRQFIEAFEAKSLLEASLQDKKNFIKSLQKDLVDLRTVQTKHDDEMREQFRKLAKTETKLKEVSDKATKSQAELDQAKKSSEQCELEMTSIKTIIRHRTKVVEHVQNLQTELSDCQSKLEKEPAKQ